MKKTDFYYNCKNLKVGETLTKISLTFNELFNIKYPDGLSSDTISEGFWNKFEITAISKRDFNMKVWHGYDEESKPVYKSHTCQRGTMVRVNLVTKTGNIGITDDLSKLSVDCEGVKIFQLHVWMIKKIFE